MVSRLLCSGYSVHLRDGARSSSASASSSNHTVDGIRHSIACCDVGPAFSFWRKCSKKACDGVAPIAAGKRDGRHIAAAGTQNAFPQEAGKRLQNMIASQPNVKPIVAPCNGHPEGCRR